MKITMMALLVVVGLVVGAQGFAYGQAWIHAEKGGGTGAEEAGRGVVMDEMGNSYVVGYFSGTATFGGTTLSSLGGYDIFIASYDNDLRLRWAFRAGGVKDDFGLGIALDPRGGVYITGSCSDNSDFRDSILVSPDFRKALVFLVGFTTDGNVRMARGFGSYGAGTGLAVGPSGNVYMSGYFGGGINFDNVALSATGSDAIFLASFDANGTARWGRSAGATTITGGSRRGLAVAVDKDENVYTTGWVAEATDFGDTVLYAQGIANIFLARYDGSNGTFRWLRSTGGANYDVGTGVGTDINGNIFLTGYYQGPINFLGTDSLQNENYLSNIFVAEFAPSGALTWVRSAGGAGGDEAYGIVVDEYGLASITGKFVGPARFGDNPVPGHEGEDIFIASYAHDSFINVVIVGGTGNDAGYALGAQGSIAQIWRATVTGSFQSTIAFGGFMLESAGGNDVFVAQYYEDNLDVDIPPSRTPVTITNHGGRLMIEGYADQSARATVRVVDLLGATLGKEGFIVEEGMWSHPVVVAMPSAGTYLVVVDIGNQRFHRIVQAGD
jgi:hypothetical protein